MKQKTNTLLQVTTTMLLICLSTFIYAQESLTYQLPPQEIIDLVDAPSTPSVSISPDNSMIAFIENRGIATIDDIAREELRLAGMRIDPLTNGPSRVSYGVGLRFTDIEGNNPIVVQGLPESPKIRNLRWSPDASHVAFTHTTENNIELWVATAFDGIAYRLTDIPVNDVMGNAFSWSSDNKTIFFTAIPANRGNTPQRPRVAQGPVTQESMGRKAAVRTYQDLLRDRYDEDLFDYYATSRLMKVDLMGNTQQIGKEGVIWYFRLSPNSEYILVNRIEKPYSYIVPYSRFPQTMDVVDVEGNRVYLVADVPVSDNLPQGFGATREGRRSVQWRNDAPATLYWVEALDGGDPANETEFRDQLFFLDAPFTSQPVESAKTELRYGGISWGNDDLAILYESWYRTRRSITSSFNPTQSTPDKKVIFDRSYEDRYNDPGNFQTKTNNQGQSVLLTDRQGRKLYLSGAGASPEGNRPFLDEYDISNGNTKRLWQAEGPFYEMLVEVVNPDQGLIITRRESNDMHPNFYMRNLKRNTLTQITDLPDPSEKLRDLQFEMVHYEREDGIPLSGMLYLPAGYNKETDGPLPTMLWAYPREFKSADAAGQVSGSPYSYTRVGATSPVMLATQGYAVLSNASFPIVGEDDKEPNDTFVEQLVANAEAAIDYLVEKGVTDPERVAVSGHSYGAFMTANLLAHSNLFAAGIARSGAYNRTLTPFGFQSEERTYWDNPDIYLQMSPFMNAHKIKTPLLLIHGADDNNSGTFPMQSERMYDALRGQGATVRLVMLPHEGHGYSARESALHMHWEWLNWLETYVKNK
jgi:dipeptidyl aminopeptidase/acylaminoacyl peptidase